MHTLWRVVFLCGTCGCVPLLVLLVGVDQAVAHTWNIEVADDGKLFSCMTDRHLRLDAQGHPHIAYGEDRLYYASHDGLAWHREVADSSYGVGTHASLALDDDGWPHISYTRAANGKLKYAYRDASGWHVETVDADVGYCGGQTSLALDAGGYVHISYSGAINGNLKYARRDASGWHTETLDLGGWGGLYTSLAVDPSGCPRISYYCESNGDLKYAYQDTAGWHIESADSAGDVGRHCSLALDEAGCPHISYYDSGNDRLNYAYRDTLGWHKDVLAAGGEHTSLALDGSGQPHISYCELGGTLPPVIGHFKLAHRDASGWQVETVAAIESSVHWSTSLALDASGAPHVSCCETLPISLPPDFSVIARDFTYAYRDAWGWHTETVDTAGHMSSSTSLALDAADRPHIAYCYSEQALDADLKHAYHDASGWHSETVDTAGVDTAGVYWYCSEASLALDGAGYPHISYRCSAWMLDADLKYGYRDSSGWHTEWVDTTGYVGGDASLALDGAGYPQISYYVGISGDLRYAYRDASGWHTEVVDTVGYVGEDTSLALGGAGHPHISYWDRTNEDLKYAYRDALGWHTETVDAGLGYYGGHTSLALDGAGCPHISYYDGTNDDLKYAYRDASGWHLETVDAQGSVGRYTSLALDGADYPHISYYDAYPNYDLKYAYRDGSGWHVETVDAPDDAGDYAALALDASGCPHISYHGTHDVKYAYATETVAREEASATVVSRRLRLLSVTPNPANTRATILYRLGSEAGLAGGPGSLKIFDRLGRLVAASTLHAPPTGTQSVWWDLTSSDGTPVAPGVYYLRLEVGTPRSTDVGRLVVIR